MAEEFKPEYTFTEDRLNELKRLFPEAFEDGVFNLDTLKTLIGEYSTDNNAKEHFGLNWVGKQDARKIAAKPPTGTLKPCPGEGVNEENTENIFIEGENLEVLKILRKSYMGKIKLIYIDPPYNTGNDFIYNDTFADSTEDYLRKTGEKSDEGLLISNPKSSGKYHANWLSFMYPRLRIAKDLLTEDGVIYISIDDHEIDNLRLLCDEIFGEENLLANLVWDTNHSAQAGVFKVYHQYVLVYCKDNFHISTPKSLDNDLFEAGAMKKESKRHPLSIFKFPKGTRIEAENGKEFNGTWGGAEKVRLVSGKMIVKDSKLVDDVELEAAYTQGNQMKQYFYGDKENIIDSRGQKVVEFYFNSSGKIKIVKKRSVVTPPTVQKFGTQSAASSKLAEFFGYDQSPFDSPKPVEMIKEFCGWFLNDSDIVLDFFAGSGTTAHSVLEFSNETQKNIKYITVQLPEVIKPNNFAYSKGFRTINEITKKRIALAESKYNKKGFKVYSQSISTIYKWQEFIPEKDGSIPDLFSRIELAYKNPLQDGVTTQDFITEVILQEGFPLTVQQEEVVSGIYKITHDWVPYTLYATMLYSFKNTDFAKLNLQETDHFVCLDKAFEGNDALKQQLDNQCKLYTI